MDRSQLFVFFAAAMSVAAAGCNPDVHSASSTIDGAGFEFKLTPISPRLLEHIKRMKQAALGSELVLGYVPESVDLSHIKGTQLQTGAKQFLLQKDEKFYDLRKLGKLTPIRSQNVLACCWAFPPFGSLESVLLPGENWDFSENNLRNLHGFDLGPDDGGNALMAAAYLSRGSGPISEKDDPLPVVLSPETSPKGLSPKKLVTEVLHLPDRAGPLDNAEIKHAVKNHGPVMTCMHWKKAHWSYSGNAHYNPKPHLCTHTVNIIGWDDDFSASKFITPPPGNGAFIFRNSWGVDWGENGYGYVSYYDGMIGTKNFIFSGVINPLIKGKKYQYDTLGWITNAGYDNPVAWMANVFTSKADDELQLVSFYTTSPKSTYEIYIYDEVISGPTSKSLLGSMTGAFDLAGYHTVFLGKFNIKLQMEKKFSVVVKLTTPNFNSPIAIEYPITNYSGLATANAGESYVSEDGVRWDDLTTKIANANVCLKAFTGSMDSTMNCAEHVWNGKTWVSKFKPSTTVCRAARGPCDQVEKCDGKSAMCPKDQLEPSTRVCRKSGGPCDVEEKCTGTSIQCPGDRLSTKGSVCREALDECDHPEYCSGDSMLCPQDLFKDDGLSCSTGQGACRSGFCVLYSGCAYPTGRPSPSAFTRVFGLLLLLAALFSGRRLSR